VGAGTVGISWLQATKLHYQWIEVVLVLVFESPRGLLTAGTRSARAVARWFARSRQARPFEASCCKEVDQPIIECKYYGSARGRHVGRSSVFNDVNRRRRVAGAIPDSVS